MLLFPKKVKHRKWQTGRKNPKKLSRPETRGIELAFGSHGLKATTQARVTSEQIEAARKVIVKKMGKLGKMWIRIFPDRPVTQKPSEVKMGKGKGDPKGFVFEVKPGRILFEIDGVKDDIATLALSKAAMKLPLKAKVVKREQ